MSVVQWAMGVSLLTHGCFSSAGETERGCSQWTMRGEDVCCRHCNPGNRVVKLCGPDPKDLCAPCDPGTYTVEPRQYSCTRCTQCEGAQVLVKTCTSTADTVCGCAPGLRCGDTHCSFCIEECGKGEEPAKKRSCRTCPRGTFNDQIHQKCKPWRTRCPHAGEFIVAAGDAVSDSKCSRNASIATAVSAMTTVHTAQTWPLVISCVLLASMVLSIISINTVVKIIKKTKKTQKETPIIRNPTDDLSTLIAVECSFHEAEQERRGSSESLASSYAWKGTGPDWDPAPPVQVLFDSVNGTGPLA